MVLYGRIGITRTKTQILITAYVYAKFLAIVSLEALKSANERAPRRTARFNQATQAVGIRIRSDKLKEKRLELKKETHFVH